MALPVKIGNKTWSGIMFVLVSALMGLLLSGLVVPFAAVAGLAAKSGATAIESLPANLETPPQSQGSKIFLGDGTELATIYAEDRTYVPLDKISKQMQAAQVAIEDNRFFEHGALDFRGTMRALVSSGGAQGGSTITQQYVKNVQIEAAQATGDSTGVLKAQERTMARKVQELRYAIAMEKRFRKDEILERYLNIVGYGGQTYGVEAAAHRYFNKHASDLTWAESAMIAGIVQNPSAFNPAMHPQAATERRNVVLARMLQVNVINQKEFDEAKATTFDSNNVQGERNGCVGSKYANLCDYAVRELYRQTPSLGKDPDERASTIAHSGMTIKLSIDPKLQESAQKAIAGTVAPTDPVIATFAMVQPGSGKILVMAQSRPDQGSGPGQTFWNYNAHPSLGGAEGYQAGSTFKIFTAAAAIEAGVPPTKTFNGASKQVFRGKQFNSCNGAFTQMEDFSPQNDAGHQFGMVDMYLASQQSINGYYVNLEQSTSICGLAKMGDAAGVEATGQNDDGTRKTLAGSYSGLASLTLGPVEVSPLSMANAYATFGARGKHCDTSIISSITSRDGKQIAVKDPKCQQVIKTEVADAVNAVYSTVVTDSKGSGHATLVPGNDQAGKTGTTDTQGTVWYDGYTPDFAASSMVTTDKADPYWQARGLQNIAGLTTKAGRTLTGYGAPDCTTFFSVPWKEALNGGPHSKFNGPPPDLMKGQLVNIPAGTGNADADEKRLKDAGFNVARTYVNANYPANYYLGPEQSGQAPKGSTINLRFSSGPGGGAKPSGGTQPTQAPTTKKS